MKTVNLLIFIFLFANSALLAQRTFKVCDVEPKKELFPEFEYADLLQVQKSGNAKLTAYPHNIKVKMLNIGTLHNHFAVGLQLAYAYHRPFVISPDMIWLLICQGFANHVKENSEQLRSKFVDFEGKKTLTVYEEPNVDITQEETWVNMLPKFRLEMQKYLGKTLHNTVLNEFSTSTDISKIAFEVSLIDAMSPYFDYHDVELCGIPIITLEGTVEDWKKIKEKANELKKYDLAWWIDELNPILNEIISTAEGKENQEFWQNIYKYRLKKDRDCGENPELITGWVGKLFPYIKKSEHSDILIKSPFIKADLKNIAKEKQGYALWAFPTSISCAKIKFFPLGKLPKDMEFIAGMIGISQNKETFALKPEINWAIYENLPIENGQEFDYPDFEAEISLLPRTKDTEFVNNKKEYKKDTVVVVPKPVIVPKPRNDEEEEEKDSIFKAFEVEEEAEPEGGMEEFYQYLSKNLIYPESAKKQKIEGKVYLQFVVNEGGKLSDIKVVKGLGMGFDEEAERLLKNSPVWSPAKQKGKTVKQRMVIPIIFSL